MTEPQAGSPAADPAAPGREAEEAGGTSVVPIDPGPIEASLDPGANPRSIWPAIYPELLKLVREHTSTIIFVNNRRGAERLAKRLNELHNEVPHEELPATEHDGFLTPHARRRSRGRGGSCIEEIARAHHGSLAHEERVVVEELLKSGKLPCLVATSSLELGIDMGALDLVIQVESPKSVSRGLQRVGRAGHQLNEVSKGRIFPKFRADLLECAVVAKRMRDGEIEETVIPRNPLDVLAQHLVSMVADDEWEVDEVERVVTASRAVLRALARAARERARHARRPLSVGEVRRAAPAPGLGPHRGHGPRPQGRPPARGHQRRHDPRPRPLRRPPPRRPPGRRARRGDGLRGAPGSDLPARGDHLADPGDHPRPGDRRPGAGRPRGGAVLARRRGRPPARARPRDRRLRPRGGEHGRRDARRRLRPRSPCGREPAHLPARAAGGDPGGAVGRDDRGGEVPRRDRRLAPVRALALRRPRARRLGPGALGADPRRARPRGGRDLVRRRDRRPPARRRSSRPTRPWSCSSPTRSRTWSSASSAARRCSGPAFARTPPAAC